MDWVAELLSSKRIEQSGYFDPEVVAGLMKKIKRTGALGETDDMMLAGLLSTELVHQQFIDAYIAGDEAEMAKIQTDPESQTKHKLVNDPRVTRVGKILRKTSLDELPQIWNVIKGEMSLVGPRPPLPYEVEKYHLWHFQRLTTLPGITGLWQVSGRSSTSFDEMVSLDLKYIENQSIWRDIKILIKTIPAVLSGKGAE